MMGKGQKYFSPQVHGPEIIWVMKQFRADGDMAGLEVLRIQCQQSISTQTEYNGVISQHWSLSCIHC